MSDQDYIRRQKPANEGLFLSLSFTNIGARIWNSGNQSITTGTFTALGFDTARYDDLDMHVGGSPTRLTALVAGTYAIFGCAQYASNATGIREILVRVNGANYIAVQDCPALSGVATTLAVATEYQFAQGDYVELVAYQSSGGNLNVVASSDFSPAFGMWRMP